MKTLLWCLLAACAWGQTEPIMSGSLTLIGNPVMCYTGPALDGCNIETFCDNGSESITAMACTPKRVLENWLGMPAPIAPHHVLPPLPEPMGFIQTWITSKPELFPANSAKGDEVNSSVGWWRYDGEVWLPIDDPNSVPWIRLSNAEKLCPVTPTVVPAVYESEMTHKRGDLVICGELLCSYNEDVYEMVPHCDPDDVLLTSESGRKWCLRVK